MADGAHPRTSIRISSFAARRRVSPNVTAIRSWCLFRSAPQLKFLRPTKLNGGRSSSAHLDPDLVLRGQAQGFAECHRHSFLVPFPICTSIEVSASDKVKWRTELIRAPRSGSRPSRPGAGFRRMSPPFVLGAFSDLHLN